MAPLCDLPKQEMDAITSKYPDPMAAFLFIERNFATYKKYFKRSFQEFTDSNET